VVEEGWMSADETANYLGITLNNLRQIQFRKNLVYGRKEGRKVFYAVADVQAYQAKREARKAKQS
jgi:hypothetical protein